MKKLLLSLVFTSMVAATYGQGYLSFYQLRDLVPQTQGLNPAYAPQNGFVFSIPALNSSFETTASFPASDLLVDQGDGRLKIDFQNLLANTEEENELGLDFTSNLFHFQVRGLGGSLSLFSNARGSFNLRYDDDLINLLANGNGNSIGQTISLGEDLNFMTYNEYGIGYTTQLFEDKLTLGVRLKYLNGQFYAGTQEGGTLDIYTAPGTYDITMTANGLGVQTAGLDILLNPDDYDSNALGNYAVWTDNTGFAADFGATFKLTERVTLEASVTDIGSINWSDMVTNYSLNNASTTIDGSDLRADGDEEGGFDEIESEIEDFFEANENYEEFQTKLNMKTYFGATYMIHDSHRLGMTMYNNSVFGTFNPSYAASYNWLPGRKTTLGVLASFGGMIQEPMFGANLATNLGPIQFYAATNNFLGLTKPQEINAVDVRFGLNIMLGYKRVTKTRISQDQSQTQTQTSN
ncbi:DUF5723 family protein [Flavobacteriaceae bacterium]|nr:DUF5723 family protein [Flavobacteriaceae bacterium]